MKFTFILFAVLFLVFFYLGYQIKEKQNIKLIHKYHYANLKEKDIKNYTRLVGISLYVLSLGMLISGILIMFLPPKFMAFVFFGSFVISFFIMHMAQKKYNGSWFS